MALGTTSIYTELVSDTIALASNDIGELCTKAKTGGSGGYAFSIVETGSGINDGYLFKSYTSTTTSFATPYWNIYANNSPGEWVLPASSSDPVEFRLKRDEAGQRYCFRLGNFREYEHTSYAPISAGLSRTYAKTIGGSVTVSSALKIKLGSYDWRKLDVSATHCKCKIFQSDGTTEVHSSSVMPLTTDNKFITFSNVDFVVSTGSVRTYNYISKISICNSIGDELCVLPEFGSIVIDIVDEPTNLIKVIVAGNHKVFTTSSPILQGGNSYYTNGTYNSSFGISANHRILQSITYALFNKTTNAAEGTTVVTSFDAYESPTILDIYFNGDAETFYTSFSRVSPSASQYLVMTMEYI